MMPLPSDLVVSKRMSAKNFLTYHLLAGLLAVAIWVGGVSLHIVSTPIVFLVGLLPLGAGLFYSWLVRISTEYRVFNDSLEVESGLIARNIENIQLFRVRDVGLKQSLLGRILNVGTVYVTSTDQSDPHLHMHGVDDPRGLYQTLRELIAKSQAARRTMIVEEEIAGSPSE